MTGWAHNGRNEPVAAHSDPLELMTIRQISQLLKRSRAALYEDIAAGKLRTVKLGTSTRVPRMEVERYVYGDNSNGCEPGE
jgi:excisionase family DNA binding protein